MDGEVQDEIRAKVRAGWAPTQIRRHLQEKAVGDARYRPLPDIRTIRAVAKAAVERFAVDYKVLWDGLKGMLEDFHENGVQSVHPWVLLTVMVRAVKAAQDAEKAAGSSSRTEKGE